MKLIHWKISLVIGVVIFILCMWRFKITIGEVAGWIYFGTMIAVIFYAMETWAMRKELLEQTELSMTPLITLHLEEDTNIMRYENVGYGPAKNIKISDLKKIDQRGETEERYEFDIISAMKPGGNEILWNYEIYDPNNQIVQFSKDIKLRSARLGKFCKEQSPTFIIIYENLKGKKDSYAVKCGPEGCKFL